MRNVWWLHNINVKRKQKISLSLILPHYVLHHSHFQVFTLLSHNGPIILMVLSYVCILLMSKIVYVLIIFNQDVLTNDTVVKLPIYDLKVDSYID